MAYTLQFQLVDTIATGSTLNSGATTTTLTGGNFGSPSGTQLYVVDYDVPGSAEMISATVTGTAVTGITRGLSGGAAGTTNHAAGAKIGAFFVPEHYNRVANRLLGYSEITASFTSTATPAITDITSVTSTVTVPTGGCRIKITVMPTFIKSTAAANSSIVLYIREGGTTLSQVILDNPVSDRAFPAICTYISPSVVSAGSHTYKASISQAAAGTMTFGSAGATGPAYILVENIE